MNIVRKADAVTILDVINSARCPPKPHENPLAGDFSLLYRILLITRYVFFESIAKFTVLVLGEAQRGAKRRAGNTTITAVIQLH